MKLLFDNNLSPRLVTRLSDLFADSIHVANLALERADDDDVWAHAEQHGLTIVTKDGDFNDLLVVRGFPPKVVLLRVGNVTTAQVETILRSRFDQIQALDDQPTVGILVLL